jgi:hypothetical protein
MQSSHSGKTPPRLKSEELPLPKPPQKILPRQNLNDTECIGEGFRFLIKRDKDAVFDGAVLSQSGEVFAVNEIGSLRGFNFKRYLLIVDDKVDLLLI